VAATHIQARRSDRCGLRPPPAPSAGPGERLNSVRSLSWGSRRSVFASLCRDRGRELLRSSPDPGRRRSEQACALRNRETASHRSPWRRPLPAWHGRSPRRATVAIGAGPAVERLYLRRASSLEAAPWAAPTGRRLMCCSTCRRIGISSPHSVSTSGMSGTPTAPRKIGVVRRQPLNACQRASLGRAPVRSPSPAEDGSIQAEPVQLTRRPPRSPRVPPLVQSRSTAITATRAALTMRPLRTPRPRRRRHRRPHQAGPASGASLG
jgi:hypothetical protein